MKVQSRPKFLPFLVLALVLAVIINERQKPAAERTWHGRLFGFVPYDFRRPDLDRMRKALWNPDDSRILTPNSFGIGWSINIYRIYHLQELLADSISNRATGMRKGQSL